MTIQPVDNQPKPQYPDKYAEDVRRTLAAAQPGRWLAAPLVVGVLASTVALGLSGCGETATLGVPVPAPVSVSESTQPATQSETTECDTDYITMDDPTMAPTTTVSTTKAVVSSTARTTQSSTSILETSGYVTLGVPTRVPTGMTLGKDITISANKIVPLFEYGDGIGSFGCVSVAAPYFMSEDEAFAILQAAFAEAGVALNAEAPEIKKATLPVTNRFNFVSDDKSLKTQKGTLAPDGTVSGIPMEFVSIADVKAWESLNDNGMWASVEQYEMKKAAQVLAKNNAGLVVFYDPVVKVGMEWNNEENEERGWLKNEQEAHAESERLLRQQVQAFVAWLNTEGTP